MKKNHQNLGLCHLIKIPLFLLLYNAKEAASFYSGRWNTGTNPDLAFASVGPNSRLPDRRVLEKFPRWQHRPSLITPPRFDTAVPSIKKCLLIEGTSARPNGVITLLWRINSQKIWCRLIHLMHTRTWCILDAAYQDFCSIIKKAAKNYPMRVSKQLYSVLGCRVWIPL